MVGSGQAQSVSGFVQHAVSVSLDDVAGWGVMLAEALSLDRDDRQVIVLLARAAEAGARVTIPASALTQAIRWPDRQVRLARLIRQPQTDVVALDRVDAVNVGRLLAAGGTADITDAHVVVCTRRAGQQVVTTDPDDLRRLDPHLDVVPI